MSINKLQNGIRKLKNPLAVVFTADRNSIPAKYLENGESTLNAFDAYAQDLLLELKGIVPAVRFGFGSFAMLGAEGLTALANLLAFAKKQEYYVILDAPEMLSPQDTVLTAEAFMGEDSIWPCDGLVISPYIGSDGIKPFLDKMKESDRDLFVAMRTGNRSASEIQELMAGGRLVYAAAADSAYRLGEGLVDRSGFSRIAGMGAASSAESLRNLRAKYPRLFILIDGFDYTGTNAKNCSFAFDKLGHGAIACAGTGVLGGWKESGADPVEAAISEIERMRKNLTRYITIL